MTAGTPLKWLVIFDPSLKSLDGHSHNYDHAVATAATACFDQVVVCADRVFAQIGTASMALHPITHAFSCRALRLVVGTIPAQRKTRAVLDAPDRRRAPGLLQRLWFSFRSYEFAVSLERTLRTLDYSAADRVHVFIQYVDRNELAAAERFVSRQRWRSAQFALHLFLRHDPEVTRANREPAKDFVERLLRLSRARSPKVHFLTDSDLIARDYKALTAGRMPITVVPIPVPFPPQPIPVGDWQEGSPIIRIAMLGASRMEKGFGSATEILASLPAQFGRARVHFAVQVNRASRDLRVQDVIRRLEIAAALAASDRPLVELLDGPVPKDDYAEWFKRTDILVMPYASPKYRASTSGVFVEGVHFGIPCVVAAGTWMAARIEESAARGLCIGLVASDIGSIAAACIRIWCDCARFRDDTIRFAQEIRADTAACRIVSAIG